MAYLLPCLGRIEIDEQATGAQAVSIEDSLAHFHGSRGRAKPASAHLRSEPAIVAGIARATLAENPRIPWEQWVGDYGKVRAAIEATFPATFAGLDAKMFQPGGLARPLAARERKWNTRSGKANFIVPTRLFAGDEASFEQPGVLQLTTLRSNDQFNTTVYGYDDRFRGVRGTRMVVFMNAADIAGGGFADGDSVTLSTALGDGVERRVAGLRIVAYNIPKGCVGAYFPEINPLVPLSHHDAKAHTPAYKAIPERFARDDGRRRDARWRGSGSDRRYREGRGARGAGAAGGIGWRGGDALRDVRGGNPRGAAAGAAGSADLRGVSVSDKRVVQAGFNRRGSKDSQLR